MISLLTFAAGALIGIGAAAVFSFAGACLKWYATRRRVARLSRQCVPAPIEPPRQHFRVSPVNRYRAQRPGRCRRN